MGNVMIGSRNEEMNIVCMLEVLLVYGYVIIVYCLDTLCSPHSPLSPLYCCHQTALVVRDVWREGVHKCPLHGAIGNGEGLLLGRCDSTSPPIKLQEGLHQWTAKRS